jgi:sigma-B regulation protein RsbU (phosphoserine phosphatase)
MVLGVLPDAVCKRGIIQLRPCDVFAAYTDGITEAMDVHGEQYCVERLVDVVLSERISPASRIVEIVLSEVERFSTGAPDGDDRVMLIVKVT